MSSGRQDWWGSLQGHRRSTVTEMEVSGPHTSCALIREPWNLAQSSQNLHSHPAWTDNNFSPFSQRMGTIFLKSNVLTSKLMLVFQVACTDFDIEGSTCGCWHKACTFCCRAASCNCQELKSASSQQGAHTWSPSPNDSGSCCSCCNAHPLPIWSNYICIHQQCTDSP